MLGHCLNCEVKTGNTLYCSDSCAEQYRDKLRVVKRDAASVTLACCSECGAKISKRAKTCSDTCRKRRQRHRSETIARAGWLVRQISWLVDEMDYFRDDKEVVSEIEASLKKIADLASP